MTRCLKDQTVVLRVAALEKESERYIFLYDEESKDTLLKTLGSFAADKSLGFTWYDAALLSKTVRNQGPV